MKQTDVTCLTHFENYKCLDTTISMCQYLYFVRSFIYVSLCGEKEYRQIQTPFGTTTYTSGNLYFRPINIRNNVIMYKIG